MRDFEVCSALVDGEAVNVAELEIALGVAEGRQALVDFVRLRHSINAQAALPRPSLYQHVVRRSGPRGVFRWRVPLPFVAAAMLVAALMGSLVSRELMSTTESARLPEVSRELRFEPGVDWDTRGGQP